MGVTRYIYIYNKEDREGIIVNVFILIKEVR